MSTGVRKFPISTESVPLQDGAVTPRLGLYIHLPFCQHKCHYCAFVSAPPRSEDEVEAYLSALLTHLELGAREAVDRTVTSLYIGGGTPSFFGTVRLVRLFETITSCFQIGPDAEITLETNPESASEELFRELIPLGLNRVSLGAQSFNDTELHQLGRIHSAARIYEAVDFARNTGIGNLSLDLIFALPGQSLSQCRENVSQALACAPQHLSIYGLAYEEGTSLDRQRRDREISPVLDETYSRMYNTIRNDLEDAGWPQYEISNWSLPGKACRHNLLYWNREEYLAFGVSAHGLYDGVRYGLTPDVDRYMRVLRSERPNREPTFLEPELLSEYTVLSSEAMASDCMIFGLRKTGGISIPAFVQRFGYSPAERWPDAIARSIERELLEQTEERIRLTKQAAVISNEVFVHFLD